MTPSGSKFIALFMTSMVFVTLSTSALASWPNILNAENSDDQESIVKTDSEGNVYVAGTSTPMGGASSSCLAKFDPSGNLQWYVPFDYGSDKAPLSLSIDSNENAYLLSKYSDGILSLTKYDTTGGFVWATFPGNVKNYPGTPAMAIGPDNKPVVAYGTRYSTGESRIVVRKYASNAVPQWERVYTLPDRTPSTGKITVDSKNGVYVIGRLFISGFGNAGVLKFSASGAAEWQAGLSKGTNQVTDGEMDSNRNFVVLAEKSLGDGLKNSVVTKFSSVGVRQWEVIDNAVNDTVPVDLAVDSMGNAIVGAYTLGSNSDLRTTKIDASGTLLWSKSYTGEGTTDYSASQCVGVAVDSSDNVFVGGRYSSSLTLRNRYLFVKYSPAGIRKSVKTTSPSGKVDATASSITFDPGFSRVYLTGSSYNHETTRTSIYTVRYR